MTDSTDLIVPLEVNQDTAKSLYSSKADGFKKLKTDITKVLKENPASVETEAERAAVRSLAHKITRTKTAVDGMGAELAEKMRKTVAAIDANRRKFKGELDEMRDAYRKPLTEYEEAEKQREQERKRRLTELEKLKTVPFDATSDTIANMIFKADELADFDDWDKEEARAATVYEDTVKILRTAKEAAATREDMARENARLEAERKKLEEEKAAQEAERQEAERRRLAMAQAAEDARLAKEREQQAEIDRLKEEKAEEERLRKQAEQDAKEAEERAQREIKERAEEAERQRLAEIDRQTKEKAKQEADKRLAQERANKAEARKNETISDLAALWTGGEPSPADVYHAIRAGQIRHITLS